MDSRRTEQKSAADIISELHQVHQDMNKLVDYIGTFVDWWSEAKMNLQSLSDTIPLIKLDGSNPLRMITIYSRWANVKDQYVRYQIRITAIEDYYHLPSEANAADVYTPTSSAKASPTHPKSHSGSDDAGHQRHSFLRFFKGVFGRI